MRTDVSAPEPARPEPVPPAQHVAEEVATVADDVALPGEGSARGVRAVTGDDFSIAGAVGGVRGLVESVAPGLVFVVAYVITSDLTPSLVASVAVALVLVAVRLAQRTPVTQAVGGLLGVGIGVVWAWRSGQAQDYYAWGLWTNAVYLVAMLVSILVRWPVVGLVVEALRAGWSAEGPRRTVGADEGPVGAADPGATGADAAPSPFAGITAWRSDPALVRRYALATWLWVGMFALRLVVKIPLYFAAEVGWLGTAHLVLGVPLWGLVLYLTWVLVRRPRTAAPAAASPA